jgi:hypothetical protein
VLEVAIIGGERRDTTNEGGGQLLADLADGGGMLLDGGLLAG